LIAPERRARVYPVWLPERKPGRPEHRRRPRLNPLVGATVMAVLLTSPLLLYVAQSAQRAEAGYAILRLQARVAQLRAENARLQVRVSAMRSPQRIERYATTELGMAPPRQRQLAAIPVGPAIAHVEVPPPRGFLRQVASWFGRSEAEAKERPR
jgi:cell division protein FtsL